MKRNHRAWTILTLTLCALLALSGCSAARAVAAKVGDRDITVTQLRNAYENGTAYASYYGYDLSTAEGRQSFVDYMLDSLIRSELLAYKAGEAGISLTDEERAEAETAAKEGYDAFYEDYLNYAKEAGATDVEAYANQILTDALIKNNTTVKQVKQDYLDGEIESRLVAKHKDKLIEGIAPTAEELRTLYDEELASQQTQLAESAAAYFTLESYHSYGYSYMPLVVPEGLFRVRQILVEEEETANEILEKINAGEDFEALLAEYNTDPGMSDEAYAEGYLVGEGANYVEPFLNAALALTKDGEVSPVVQSDYGYHILKRIRAEEARVIPYEEVQADFDAMATTNFIEQYYADIVDGWLESDLVTRYPETYATLAE